MPGYSKEIIKGKDVDEKFICGDCRLILKNPIQTYCGHRYCCLCFDDIITRNGTNVSICELCKDEDVSDSILAKDKAYSDRAIKRELNQLKVHCVNKGCKFEGLYKDYDEEHVQSCPYESIHCIKDGCSAQFCRHKLTEHLENECLMRATTCPHCYATVSFSELNDHYEQCQQYPLTCQYCDKKNIPRYMIDSHIDATNGDCPKKRIDCPFKGIGCNIKVEETMMKEHNQANREGHLMLLFHTVMSLMTSLKTMKDNNCVDNIKSQTEEQRKQVEDLTSSVSQLSSQVSQMKQKITSSVPSSDELSLERLKETFEKLRDTVTGLVGKQKQIQMTISNHEGVVAVLSNQIEHDSASVRKLEHSMAQQNEKIESLERKIKSQDRIIAMKDVMLAEQDLRIQSLEMASYNGELVWKISNFNKKRQDAISGKTVSIYSPCFYTSRHGYKMCARIYLNGDGMGKGNHVSLFFVVMRGSYDALMRWPFRQKVTLMWLDQNNRDHVIDTFRPDPTSTSFKRPLHDMNVASGCPLFMPLSQLDNPRHAYVKDDVAFLKVIVDTSDLGL